MSEILKVMLPMVIVQVAVFAAIVVVTKRLLLSDTLKAVDRIKKVEAEVRKREEGIRQQIQDHEQEFQKKKAEAETDLERRRDMAEKEVTRMRDQILSDAKKESETIIDNARKGEEKFRRQIQQEMEEKAVEYGVDTYRLVMSEKMTDSLNGQFIDELLDAIEQIDSSSITADGDAEFKSSHPIPDAQKKRLEQLLAEKFKVHVEIQEKIVPDLLAGLVFKLGSLEIDGSLRSRLQEAASEIKKSINA